MGDEGPAAAGTKILCGTNQCRTTGPGHFSGADTSAACVGEFGQQKHNVARAVRIGWSPDPLVIRDTDGNEHRVKPELAGAEGRYEDWVYLEMLEREWRRPVDANLYGSIRRGGRPSARAIVVLVFWSYFETRIGRLFRETAKAVPGQVMDHLLERHSSVGARMDRLYRVVFSSTYRADLNDLGYGGVAALLKQVELCRNRFAHGHPEAIDDALVEEAGGGSEGRT